MTKPIFILLTLLTLLPTKAQAHAAYEASDPGNGATVSSPPQRVTADFTEPVIDDSTLEIFDPCGAQVDNGDSVVAADRVTVTMSGDKGGTYTVVFAVVSSVDGHPTNGEFEFSSSGGAPCPSDEPEAGNEAAGTSKDDTDTGTSTSRPSTGSNNTEASLNPNAPAAGTASGRNERQGNIKDGGTRQGRREGADSRSRSRDGGRIRLEASDGSTNPGNSPGDTLPLDGLFWGFALASLIGLSAGLIYNGLLGPGS